MSIEWLLTKTTGTEAQSKPSIKPHKEEVLSDKDHVPKSRELNQETEVDSEERLREAKYFSSAEMQNRHSEINLCCTCGCTGTVTQSKTDFKLLRTDKNGFAYFECSNCKRHLRYNSSTGEIKIQKGILGALLGRFS